MTSRLAQTHGWIAQQADLVYERLHRWCDQNSGSYNLPGLGEMASMLIADMQDLDVPAQRVELPAWEELNDDGDQVSFQTTPALIWHCRQEAAHRVLLLIHYDTVYPPHSPTVMRREADRFWAPGAADAKGGIAVLHLALAALQRFALTPSLGWSIVLNPDEEIGSPASRGLLESIAKDYDFAMVFEPSLPDGAWVADRKGSGNWSFLVEGQSAHAGRNPEQGRNAITQASRLVQSLDALNDPDRGRTVNVGRIRGGGPLNRVPDRTIVRVNCRISDAADEVFLERQFHELAQRFSGDGFRCSVHGELHAPVKQADPFALQLRQRMQAAAEAVSRTVVWRNTGGACDGSKLAAYGLPNIDTLGPRGDHLHSADEYCDLQSIVPAARTVVQALHDFAADPSAWPTRAIRQA